MEKTVQYDCRWSDKLDEKYINDFLFVEQTVFGDVWTREMFNRKFIENIYGLSLIVVVYVEGRPAAARSFWRNDVCKKEAYQPGDTCVISEYRGLGLFTKMTKVALEFLSGNEVIYNYPNNNSYPGYLKMGWSLVGEYYQRVLLFNNQYYKEDKEVLDIGYARWWLLQFNGVFSIKRGKDYFLVRKNPKRPFLYILARVNKETAALFTKTSPFAICFFMSQKKTWYNSHLNTIHVVSRNGNLAIPLWKMDAI